MERTGLIYKITNLVNDKCYVGQTIQTLKKRKRGHIQYFLKQRNDYLAPIYLAFKKYGLDNFKWEVLEENIPLKGKNNLNEREKFWGNYYNALSPNGYSLILGNGNENGYSDELRKMRSIQNIGNKNCLGCKHSEEWKREASIRNKEYYQTHVHPTKGKKLNLTKEQKKNRREKIRIYYETHDSPLKGKPFSEEHKNKIAISKSNPLKCYDLNYNFVGEFSSRLEASQILNVKKITITNALKGKQMSAGGYIWRWKDRENENKILDEKYRKCKKVGSNRKKIVVQYNLNGDMIRRWNSATEASKTLGFYRKCISDCCLGKQKTHRNFIWKFE